MFFLTSFCFLKVLLLDNRIQIKKYDNVALCHNFPNVFSRLKCFAFDPVVSLIESWPEVASVHSAAAATAISLLDLTGFRETHTRNTVKSKCNVRDSATKKKSTLAFGTEIQCDLNPFFRAGDFSHLKKIQQLYIGLERTRSKRVLLLNNAVCL